jgi:hypothetical protein
MALFAYSFTSWETAIPILVNGACIEQHSVWLWIDNIFHNSFVWDDIQGNQKNQSI